MPLRVLQLNNPAQDTIYTDAVVALLERATVAQSTPYVYPHDRGFFEKNLAGETINILAFDQDKVVAYAALRSMKNWPDYLEPCHYPPERCALMLYNLVDPEYRGQGIGKQLSAARLKAAVNAGFEHLFTTVHPDNEPSIRVLTKLGFQVIAQKPMFSNQLMRKLMYLHLTV